MELGIVNLSLTFCIDKNKTAHCYRIGVMIYFYYYLLLLLVKSCRWRVTSNAQSKIHQVKLIICIFGNLTPSWHNMRQILTKCLSYRPMLYRVPKPIKN